MDHSQLRASPHTSAHSTYVWSIFFSSSFLHSSSFFSFSVCTIVLSTSIYPAHASVPVLHSIYFLLSATQSTFTAHARTSLSDSLSRVLIARLCHAPSIPSRIHCLSLLFIIFFLSAFFLFSIFCFVFLIFTSLSVPSFSSRGLFLSFFFFSLLGTL
jgi:hypothetical protein